MISCAEDIVSTVPASADGSCTTTLGTPGYDAYAGTSMATPHVAGVAALLTAQGRSRADVIRILKQTARTPVTGTRGTYTPAFGHGIVDAQAAVGARRSSERSAPDPPGCRPDAAVGRRNAGVRRTPSHPDTAR